MPSGRSPADNTRGYSYRGSEEVRKPVENLGPAGTAGAQLAQRLGGNSMEHFHKALDMWKQGGALEVVPEEMDERKLVFKVTRCRYAEMYRKLGCEELGEVLSCGRDAAFAAGFNPKIRLIRNKTLMSGGPYCDFRFELE